MKLSTLISTALDLKRFSAENGLDLDPDVLIEGEYHPVAVAEVDYGLSVSGGRVTAHLLLTPEHTD